MSANDARRGRQASPAHHRIPLDRLTWTRWRESVRSFATSEVGGRGKALFAALFLLLIAINGLNVVNSYVGRNFMTAIEARSIPRFVSMAMLYVGVFAVSTVAAVIYRFIEERLALLWREWLTRRLVSRYLQDDTYYWLREHTGIANPDQRIADDVRSFTATTISLTLVLLNTTFTIVAFSGVMWSISPLLFGTAVAYAAIGSVLTVLLGKPLIWLNYAQSDREASLRAELVHLRENAESVAVVHREGRLGARLQHRVDELIANTRRIIAVNRNLGFFTTGYNYLIQIIPVLIVAPLFFRGEAEFGEISQSAMAFSHLLGAFSLVVLQFQQISGYLVVLSRVFELGESIERVAARGKPGIKLVDGGEQLAWQGLTLHSPHDRIALVRSLTLAIDPDRRVLVTGSNEAARIALFRATAGLWRTGEGRIGRPPPAAIHFVPERPYLPPGTLREVLLRTAREHAAREERIAAVLRELELDEVVARAGGLDVEHDWDDTLSLAEQQRVSYARVLLDTPRFVVQYNPATLLGAALAAYILELLAAQSIAAVTFAADDALAARHDIRLLLDTAGAWRVQAPRDERRRP